MLPFAQTNWQADSRGGGSLTWAPRLRNNQSSSQWSMGMSLPSAGHVKTPPFSLSRSDCIQRRATLGTRGDSKGGGFSREPLHVPTRPNPIQRSDNWFGGDGKKAGYSSRAVYNIITRQTKPRTRRTMTKLTLEFYADKFAGITVLDACYLLRLLGCGQDVIYRYSDYTAGFRLISPIGVASLYSKSPLCVASNYRPMEFVGGPPGRLRSCQGTILTMLLDRITVIALLEGAYTLDRIIPPTLQSKLMA